MTNEDHRLTPEQRSRVDAMLRAVLPLRTEDREQRIDELAEGDAVVSREVRSLLALDPETNVLGDTADWPGAAIGRIFRAPMMPRTIGPYRVVKLIGSGGMGEVYHARQCDPVEREVALKFVRYDQSNPQALARFQAERRALALMRHPNIAQLYDPGESGDGELYLAMEYIHGVPITEYCDGRALDLRSRLKLFVTLCRAVQHAHEKSVIHRDIKPQNVLVTEEQDEPLVKLIDFGIAKGFGRPLGADSVQTQPGMGTPVYMSPEQAAGSNGESVDVRTDVYALGILMYELLTGTTPIRGDTTPEDILRQVRELEPPPPSKRLSSLIGDELESIESARGRPQTTLTRQIRGDLDWIVMRALEKDRDRRYEGAAALAADIERYLRDEPIEAGPPGAAYRVRKFARRHRGFVTAVTAVVATAAVGVTMLGVSWSEASRQRNDAIRQAEIARQLNQILQGMFAGINPEIAQGMDTELLMLIFSTADQDLIDANPAVAMEMRATLGAAYFAIGAYDESVHHLAEAVALSDTTGADAATRSVLTSKYGLSRYENGDVEAGIELVRHALSMAIESGEIESMAEACFTFTTVMVAQYEIAEAVAALDDLQETLSHQPEIDPALRAKVFNEIGQVAHMRAQHEDALAAVDQALSIGTTAEIGAGAALEYRSSRATYLYFLKRYDEAIDELRPVIAGLRELYGSDHHAGLSLLVLGWCLQLTGATPETEAVLLEASNLLEAGPVSVRADCLMAVNWLALHYIGKDQKKAAYAQIKRGLELAIEFQLSEQVWFFGKQDAPAKSDPEASLTSWRELRAVLTRLGSKRAWSALEGEMRLLISLDRVSDALSAYTTCGLDGTDLGDAEARWRPDCSAAVCLIRLDRASEAEAILDTWTRRHDENPARTERLKTIREELDANSG